MDDERETSYLRQRRMKSPMHLSCCFHRPHSHTRLESLNPPSPYSSDSEKSSPSFRSPSSWFKSKGCDHHHQLPPENKARRRHLMARLGRRPRRHSADFSYDPLSYALNFDEGESVHDQHSRLQLSPPRVWAARPRFKDLELPSPMPSGKKNVEIPMKPKGAEGNSTTAAAVSGSGKAKSPTAGAGGKSFESPAAAAVGRKSPVHGRKGFESPTEAHGGKGPESPKAAHGIRSWVHGKKSSESPTEAAHGGKSSESPKAAHGIRSWVHGRKSSESPTEAHGGEGSESPKAVHGIRSWVHGRKSSQSPTPPPAAEHGASKVQSPTEVPGKESTDSPKEAKGEKMSMERRNAAHLCAAVLGAMFS